MTKVEIKLQKLHKSLENKGRSVRLVDVTI
jgi:hypothetical protein